MTDRERLLYVGDHDLYLPGSVAPRPDLCQPERPDPDNPGQKLPGTVVEVDLLSAPLLIARGDFVLHAPAPGEDTEVPLAVEEPIPLDRLVALELLAPTSGTTDEAGHPPAESAEETLQVLSGAALTDALADAGLPQQGSDEERRTRLRVFLSAQAAELGTSTQALSLDAIREAQAQLDAQRRVSTTKEG